MSEKSMLTENEKFTRRLPFAKAYTTTKNAHKQNLKKMKRKGTKNSPIIREKIFVEKVTITSDKSTYSFSRNLKTLGRQIFLRTLVNRTHLKRISLELRRVS
jgi:hypothetical protein